jgi:hypothetical protein
MSPGIMGGPIGWAIKIATAVGKGYADKEADTIRGATEAIQKEQGINAAPFNAGGNAIFGNDIAPFRKIYTRAGDMYSGTKDSIGTFISELWNGAGFGRAIQQSQRGFYGKQTWKHPDVIRAADLMGQRTAANVRRNGMNYGGYKELGVIGG